MSTQREILSLMRQASKKTCQAVLSTIVEFNKYNHPNIKTHQHADGIRINLDILDDKQLKLIHNIILLEIEKEKLIYNSII